MNKETEQNIKEKAESPTGTEYYSRVERYGDYFLVRYMPYSLVGIKLTRQGLNKGKKLNPKLNGKWTGFASAKQKIDEIEGGKHALDSELIFDISTDTFYDKVMGNNPATVREQLTNLLNGEKE